jgi:membrane associated rhomboid family serine protease
LTARPRNDGAATWIGARPTPAATALLLATGACYLALLFLEAPAHDWVMAHLALVPRRAIGREPWQLLTSAVVHAQFGTLIGDGLGIWIFATAVELRAGSRRMLVLFGLAQLAGVLLIAAVGRASSSFLGVPFEGSSPAIMALAMAFGALYGNYPLRLFGIAEMRSTTLAWLVVGTSLFVSLVNRNWPGFAGDAGGAALGWAIFSGAGTRLNGLRRLWQRRHLSLLRGRYRVIPGDRGDKRFFN